ncbi:MAG: hypothetical protein JO171_08320 [Paludibacterium sp.]|uniref:DUF6624 domain-containing protein n=1 Tax=Paludibacterium sp. TaxID=1917523 RepID=UPI0025D9F55A|nr:DUF6624 domain-containing protein [Paludibacterium sp.]MBV8047142.1 hypothetical protein [Paludibacterium sp.]MBV8645865.1 hypothetical protein [Paludibacterium sp.]
MRPQRLFILSLACAVCAQAEPCRQTQVELTQSGQPTTLLFPPCAQIKVIARKVTEENAHTTLAEGEVTIRETGGGPMALTLITDRARIHTRAVSKAWMDDIAALVSAGRDDQRYRRQRKPSLRDAERQHELDLANQQLLQRYVDQHGWPGFRTAGVKAARAAFLIVQHADLAMQKRYVEDLRAAVRAGDAWPSSLALLEDRIDVREGRTQRYGSQIQIGADGKPAPHPIQDPGTVDQRRAEVGLEPLADYLKHFAD